MKGTRKSLKAAVEEARGCGQGDLYREGDKYFFLIGKDTASPMAWRNFWYSVQGASAYYDSKKEVLDWFERKLTERGR